MNAMSHWTLDRDENDILWLSLDKQDGSMNVLSSDVLSQLDEMLGKIESESANGLVLISGKNTGFIAGADIEEFTALTDAASAEAWIKKAHTLFARLENLPFPTVAAIKGICLGGGTELSLACTYRVACDDDNTRIGLPEVRLGIFPGFGGSVRSTEVMGSMAAMNMMLSGRALKPKIAKRLGLIDQTAPGRHLRRAAIQLLQKNPGRRRPGFLAKMVEWPVIRSVVASVMRKQVGKKAREEHYPAPYRLIDHWCSNIGNSSKMYASEARHVAELITGSTAQNLIRVFQLQEQLKSQGRQSDFKAKRVHVIGGGVMGGDIAAWCALRGLRVTLQDLSIESLARAMQRAHGLFTKRLRDPRLINAAMDRLMPDPKGVGLKQADVVIEAIFEDLEVKQKLFKQVESEVRSDTLLATNTSSIPIEHIASVLQDPTRLVGLHFFNPVAMMQLVEIVCGPDTNTEVAQHAAAFARGIDRLPLPVKSTPGFLVNRILMPYLIEAVILESEGVPAALIDEAAESFGMPMGPVELADTVGLDICLHVAKILSKEMSIEVPNTLQAKVEAGHLGKKSGQGFYKFVKGKAQKPKPGSCTLSTEEIANRMIFRLLNEGMACLRESVVESEDLLDAGIIFGTGFAPFRGGPVHYVRDAGVEKQQTILSSLKNAYGKRFKPDAYWQDL